MILAAFYELEPAFAKDALDILINANSNDTVQAGTADEVFSNPELEPEELCQQPQTSNPTTQSAGRIPISSLTTSQDPSTPLNSSRKNVGLPASQLLSGSLFQKYPGASRHETAMQHPRDPNAPLPRRNYDSRENTPRTELRTTERDLSNEGNFDVQEPNEESSLPGLPPNANRSDVPVLDGSRPTLRRDPCTGELVFPNLFPSDDEGQDQQMNDLESDDSDDSDMDLSYHDPKDPTITCNWFGNDIRCASTMFCRNRTVGGRHQALEGITSTCKRCKKPVHSFCMFPEETLKNIEFDCCLTCGHHPDIRNIIW